MDTYQAVQFNMDMIAEMLGFLIVAIIIGITINYAGPKKPQKLNTKPDPAHRLKTTPINSPIPRLCSRCFHVTPRHRKAKYCPTCGYLFNFSCPYPIP